MTISGIGLGIAMLIAILTVLSGFQVSFLRQLNTLGPNTLFVHKWKWGVNVNDWWKYKNRPYVTNMDWRALEANANLPEAVAPIVSTDAAVAHAGKELKHVDIRGSTSKYLQATGWEIRHGRFLTDLDHELGTDACVIGADVEDAFFKGQEPLGQRLRVGPSIRCTVVGTFLRKGNATVVVGVEKARLHRALLIIRDNCETRTEFFVPTAPGEVGEPYPLDPIQVQVGGATVFVLDVERFERL